MEMTSSELDALVAGVINKDVRKTARAITLVENSNQIAQQVMCALIPFHHRRTRIGITGAPGVGKSSLVNELIGKIRNQGRTVGIVAVDPTSPFSGGAVLGDRIRMTDYHNDRGVFIRSLGTRGSPGGLSRAAADVVRILEVYGCDEIIIETVGMGQAGFDIIYIADTVALVLSPEAGDGIQAMKAGVMEIADTFVINKADRPGAEAMQREIEQTLHMMLSENSTWEPKVLLASAVEHKGAEELWKELLRHREYLDTNKRRQILVQNQTQREIMFLIEEQVQLILKDLALPKGSLAVIAQEVQDQKLDPYSAARKLMPILLEKLQKGNTQESKY